MWGFPKQGNLKRPVFHVVKFTGWIKVIYDKISQIYFVNNEFILFFQDHKMENAVFPNTLFGDAPFPYGS